MKSLTYDVIVAGGGCGGSAAGIQAARLGARTLIIEETPWLGGMITAAGVSAFDGNKYAFGGGIFQELRKKLEDYYGGPEKTFTGWISLTCFEPSVGMQFLSELAAAEDKLDIFYQTKVTGILKEGNTVTGLTVQRHDGEEITLYAPVTIEATEFGDIIGMAGIPYRLGRDTRGDTGEVDAPEKHDYIVQDVTFCAILKKYDGIAPPVEHSAEYNPGRFINSTAAHATTTDETWLNHKLHSWDSFISYAALPNDKYLLNWPFRSNDYPTNEEMYLFPETRQEHYRKAKQLTLDYVHYMQTVLGHPEWGLATDEYPTSDALPFIPYVRESRRIKGARFVVESDVIPAPGSSRPPLQKDGIAVGDYFLDHHHSQFFHDPAVRLVEPLPANAPFQIPLGALIPEEVDGVLAAEKSISVSHIVNGCSRLQPVVMLIGQAAGALAAIAVLNGMPPRKVAVSAVQEVLLRAGCQLYPYKDLYADSPAFIPAQHFALHGVVVEHDDYSFREHEPPATEELAVLAALAGVSAAALSRFTGKARAEVYPALYSEFISQ